MSLPETMDPSAKARRKGRAFLVSAGLVLALAGGTLFAWSKMSVERRFADTAALSDAFDAIGYELEGVIGGRAVPRLFLAALPQDLPALDDIAVRKAVFLRSMLPLVLRANDQVAQDRARLLPLLARVRDGLALALDDARWLADLAERYDVAPDESAELEKRVDGVPPSLAMAQAIEESGWGTSRFAQEGNSLFGHTIAVGFGLRPQGRAAGDGHDIRAFATLSDAVEAYLRNLNTHPAYAALRQERARLRAKDKPLDGYRLAASLTRYSERGADYVRTVRSIIRANGLAALDVAKLSSFPTL